jgi:cold shock CspA family protein
MGKSHETWNKREVRNKKEKKRKDKEKKKVERKENTTGPAEYDNMIAYVDENGNITSTPPDLQNRRKINAEEIEISTPKRTETDDVVTVRKGTVTMFNESKGYGFIKDHNSQDSVFFHKNDLETAVHEGSKVSFMVEKGPKGLNAVNVKSE